MISAVAFTLFCLICTVFAFTRHPIWGIYFYLATTYVFPPGRWWGYIFGDLRWALIAAIVCAASVVFHRGKLVAKPTWCANAPTVLLITYAVWMWVQTAWALDFNDHLKGCSDFTKCLFSLWFFYRATDTKEHLRDMMFGHVLGCGLLGVYAQMQGREGNRLDGVGGPNIDDANTLGMLLVTGAVCALGLVMSQTGWRRYASLLALPVITNGFVLTNSRGAFLGLVAGVLVLAFAMAKRHRWMLLTMAVVGAIGLSVIVDKVFIDRMFTIQDVASDDEEADTSARSRLIIAEAQIQMFFDYPMGTGWRGTAVLSPRYMDEKWLAGGEEGQRSRSSHNTYLTALSEQGIPGALIYSMLVLWVISSIFRVRRMKQPWHDPEVTTLGASLCASLIVVLVAGATADYLTKEVQFWLYAGLLSALWLGETVKQPAPVAGALPTARRVPA